MNDAFTTSVSAVELFDTCNRKYLLERLLKRGKRETLETVVGSFYHEVFAEVNKALFRGEKPDVAKITFHLLPKHRLAFAPFPVKEADLFDEVQENFDRLLPLMGEGRFHALEVQEGIPLVERKFFKNRLGYNGVVDLGSRNSPIVDDKGRVYGWEPEPGIFDLKILSGQHRRSARDAIVSAQLALYCLDTGLLSAGYIEVPRNLERDIQIRTVKYQPDELARWQTWFENRWSCLEQRQALFEALKGAVTEDELPEGLASAFPMVSRTCALCSPVYCNFYFNCYKPLDKGPTPVVGS